MGEPLLAFIALAGSALLGFLFCASISRLRLANFMAEKSKTNKFLKEKEIEIVKLQDELDSKNLTIENLRKISESYENQAFENDDALKKMGLENQNLQNEIQQLIENPIEKIKEIDVIREVPVLVLREINVPESRMEKAKKLMKAFTKGYLDENGILQAINKEEAVDD
ncbi:MAG: hypothetical protein GC192_02810 [Bacteroidetes bacterium]|nr:hypothetical protein [Bacteroidota bacterium]